MPWKPLEPAAAGCAAEAAAGLLVACAAGAFRLLFFFACASRGLRIRGDVRWPVVAAVNFPFATGRLCKFMVWLTAVGACPLIAETVTPPPPDLGLTPCAKAGPEVNALTNIARAANTEHRANLRFLFFMNVSCSFRYVKHTRGRSSTSR